MGALTISRIEARGGRKLKRDQKPTGRPKGRRALRLSQSKWEFGATIGARRVALGWTQEEAADRMGIERQTYGQLESGARMSCEYATVDKIAKAYGLDPVTLWVMVKTGKVTNTTVNVPAGDLSSSSPSFPHSSAAQPLPAPPVAQPSVVVYDVPIRAVSYIAGDDAMHLGDAIVDYAPRPRGIERAVGVFGLRMLGGSMEPVIRDGTLL